MKTKLDIGYETHPPLPGEASRLPLQTDRQEVDRCLAGDEAAFERLVRHYSPELYRLSWRLLGNTAAAEEITQEALTVTVRATTPCRA